MDNHSGPQTFDEFEREVAPMLAPPPEPLISVPNPQPPIGPCRSPSALRQMVEMTCVPDPNCSCQIYPPCSDCVEYGGIREAMECAHAALKGSNP